MLNEAINGKILNVNLTAGTAEPEELPEETYRKYLGGYGLGARLLFDRIPAGADPLGPDNVLGLFPGLLTGTPLFGIRFQAVAKSPKSGGWGDANCGGDFGPFLKHSGWDGILMTGMSGKPVYILIEDEKVQIKDAADLWGMLAIDVEDALKERHGKKASVACIGPGGETMSLMAGICNERGRLAARSGLGAVMGSKKVKAVVVLASKNTLAGEKEIYKQVRAGLDDFIAPLAGFFRSFGTTGITAGSALSGDSPVKNWGGIGSADFPDSAQLAGPLFNEKMEKKYACWHCPLACGAESKESENPKYPYPKHTHRAEYEAACGFGTMMLSADIDALQYANHLCNQYGIDVISAGATVAFAMECFENGIITKEDTDGIDLRWGNTEAIIDFLKLMGERKGIGEVFADGVRTASEKLGRERTAEFAIEIGGEELPMHDPKLQPEYFTTYKLDPTPSRHTQYEGASRAEWGVSAAPQDSKVYSGRGEHHKGAAAYMHVVNSLGMCQFVMLAGPNGKMPEWVNSTTGWDTTPEEIIQAGERIANLRMAFSVREGDIVTKRHVPDRVTAPQKGGPLDGVKLDAETLEKEYLAACDWDLDTATPSKAKLTELGLEDVAAVLHA